MNIMKTLAERLHLHARLKGNQPLFHFLKEGDSVASSLTSHDLLTASNRIATYLAKGEYRGQRAILLYPPGLEFVEAFLGCLKAGVVAVPVAPLSPTRTERTLPRLLSIVKDCQPAIALVTTQLLQKTRQIIQETPELANIQWIATDRDLCEENQGLPDIQPETLAILQYTSGSTSDPKGVMLTHANLMHNLSVWEYGWGYDEDSVIISWLPHFHDLGLLFGVLFPIYKGVLSCLLPPSSVAQKPIRWLRAITDFRGTHSAGPNFIYDLCVQRIDRAEYQGLDLRSWKVACNGAEPVRLASLKRFAEKFGPVGLQLNALTPGYGLAEATCRVTARCIGEPLHSLLLQPEALERNQILIANAEDSSARAFVGCGQPVLGMDLKVVRPEEGVECSPQEIGEIWVSSGSVGIGYWNRPEETARVFSATLKSDEKGKPFLRTGDLGFMHQGQLYITGRAKDLIIVCGANHYPQDIEYSVERAHPALRPNSGVAFAIDKDGEDGLVVVQEVVRQYQKWRTDEIISAIRHAISRDHDLAVGAIALIRVGTIPKTSSGKVQRSATRKMFFQRALDAVVLWEHSRSPDHKIEARPHQVVENKEVLPTDSGEKIKIEVYLVNYLANLLGVETTKIGIEEPFSSFGLGSRQALVLAGELEAFLGYPVPATAFYDYPSIREFANSLAGKAHITEKAIQAQSSVPVRPMASEAIAIVGMACRFPGAEDIGQFWTLICEGRDATSFAPPDRYALKGRGGFVANVKGFDNSFFGVSARESAFIDPQQRLALEVVWEALEDASIIPATLKGTRTGVFFGASGFDYGILQAKDGCIDAYSGQGCALSIIANRIAYQFDLRGPSLIVDTACSSSLTAVHQARRSLQAGESNMAIAGGVNLILSPVWQEAFSKAGMLSPDGVCKPFDAHADGYVRGEGCGVVILKRYLDAVKDGDHIYAAIVGSAMNQDGRSNGLTAPNGRAQEAVITSALMDANLSATALEYVEAHGTGTSLGDPIEVNALGRVIGEGQQGGLCWLGSVKANIGHLEAAAGVAGLIKTVLAMAYECIPPQPHLNTVNSLIELKSRLKIPLEPISWPQKAGHSRVAGVSSFGFGGTNVHVVLRDTPLSNVSEKCWRDGSENYLLCLSAQTTDSLRRLTRRYANYCERPARDDLRDICFTASCHRTHFRERVAILANSKTEIMVQLQTLANGTQEHKEGIWVGTGGEHPKIAMIFTGQGALYAYAGRQLYESYPVFRKVFDECSFMLESLLGFSLAAEWYQREKKDLLLGRPAFVQPLQFALQYALVELWRSIGIQPHCVMGHSLGEYVAACVAGVMELPDTLRLIALRGQLTEKRMAAGQMSAVFASEEAVKRLILTSGLPIDIAAINGPRHVVVAGRQEEMDQFKNQLRQQDIEIRCLQVNRAYHSREVEPMLEEFAKELSTVTLSKPRVSFISNLIGQIWDSDRPFSVEYFVQHLRQPVQFAHGVSTIVRTGCEIVIEVGPNPVLCTLGRTIKDAENLLWLESMCQGQDEPRVFLSSVAQTYVRGCELDWRVLYGEGRARKVSLPTYSFQPTSYWYTERPVQSYQNIRDTGEGAMDKGHREEKTQGVLRKLSQYLATLLRTSSSSIDPEKQFLELGADSIILVELVRLIEQDYGLVLKIPQLFEELSTLSALAKFVATRSQEELSDGVPGNGSFKSTSQRSEEGVPSSSLRLEGKDDQGLIGGLMQQQLMTLSQIFNRQLDILAGQSHPVTASQPWPVEQTSIKPSRKESLVRESVVPKSGTYVPYHPIQGGEERALTAAQRTHLESLVAAYARKTARSKGYAESFRPVLADYRTSMGFRQSFKEMLYPIVAVQSKGSRIWDLDGNEYVDITMGYGVNLFGHQPDFIMHALEEQLKRGMYLGPQSDRVGYVAQMVSELTGAERVAFCNSGTEAVMTALRLARATTGKKKIALFAGSYHGHADATLVRAGLNGESIPMAPGVTVGVATDVLVLPYGDERALDIIKQHRDDLAAVLVEPVQSRAPHIQPKSFLHALRDLTRSAEIVLIFDEIITGFRVHQKGVQGLFGIEADLVTYGKVVGGGMPLGLVAGRAFCMDAIDGGQWKYGDQSYPTHLTTFFAGTFSKHPMTMAAAEATLRYLKAHGPDLQSNLSHRTAQLTDQLNALLTEADTPLRVASFGSLFRFVSHGNVSVEFQPVEVNLLMYHLVNRGIYMWEGHTCFLSTAHTDTDLATILASVKAAVQDLQEGGFALQGGGDRKRPCRVEGTGLTQATDTVCDSSVRWPITREQQDMLVHSQLSPEACAAYNELAGLTLIGELNWMALHEALRLLRERHPILNAVVDPVRQEFVSDMARELILQEVKVLDEGGRLPHEAMAEWVKAQHAMPIDITKGPLLSFYLLDLGNRNWRLIVKGHHIATDGWSYDVLFQELAQLYGVSLGKDNGPSLLPSAPGNKDYALKRLKFEGCERYKAAEAYWLGRFSRNIEMLDLPIDKPRPSPQSFSGSRYCFTIPSECVVQVRALARQSGVTAFMLLYAAYSAFLLRICSQQHGVLGIPAALREDAESKGLIGFCTNVLPTVVELPVGQTVKERLLVVRRELSRALDHRDYPFGDLVRRLKLPRDSSRPVLVSSLFNFESPICPEFLDCHTDLAVLPISRTKYELSVNVIEQGDEFLVTFDYADMLFTALRIQELAGQFNNFLQAFVNHPTSEVRRLPLMTEKQRQWVVQGLNEVPSSSPLATTIHGCLELQVEKTPDAISIIDGSRQISYHALNAQANSIAERLIREGVGKNSRVGICLPRTADMIVAMLGIMKTGAAYVPLDPQYPPERIAYIAEDADLTLVIVNRQAGNGSHLTDGNKLRMVEVMQLEAGGENNQPQIRGMVSGGDLAYILYTSGSTGLPKGVAIEHQSAVAFITWAGNAFSGDALKGVLAGTSICFDLSVFEIFVPLCFGGIVIIGDSAMALPNLSAAPQVCLINTVPSIMEELLRMDGVPASVRVVNLAGEPLRRDLVQRIYQLGHIEAVYNLYGPTEATTYSTWEKISRYESEEPTIGRPIANTQCYVLDELMQPVPPGVKGELYISGTGLAREYWGKPELTASRFLFHDVAGEGLKRLYRTGDLVRYRGDGRIEFLGRLDQQVKVQGCRIELGEVEAVLLSHPYVREVVVMPIGEPGRSERYLAAYCMTANGEADEGSIRTLVRERLPSFMVPSIIVCLTAFPRLPNGKIDRTNLESYQRERRKTGEPPRTETEKVLVAIWEEGLGVKPIGVNEDFFEVGGHSLRAVQILSDVRRLFDVEVGLLDLMQAPTIAEFAVHIMKMVAETSDPKIVAELLAEVEALNSDANTH